MKTICVSEKLHREIVDLKLEESKKNTAELIRELILEHKKIKFLKASEIFRKSLKEKKLGFYDILKKSKKIREEISDEWF